MAVEYTKNDQQVNRVICDICGWSATSEEVIDFENVFSCVTFTAGYGSEYDGDRFILDVCHHCFRRHGTRINKDCYE